MQGTLPGCFRNAHSTKSNIVTICRNIVSLSLSITQNMPGNAGNLFHGTWANSPGHQSGQRMICVEHKESDDQDTKSLSCADISFHTLRNPKKREKTWTSWTICYWHNSKQPNPVEFHLLTVQNCEGDQGEKKQKELQNETGHPPQFTSK